MDVTGVELVDNGLSRGARGIGGAVDRVNLDGGDDTRVEGVPRGADVLGRVPTRGGGNRGVCGVVDDFGF